MNARTAVIVAVTLALLAVADAATTFAGVTSGVAEEANPAAAWVFDRIGLLPGAVATQALFIVIVTWLAWAATGRSRLRWTVPAACLLGLMLVKAAVVAGNVAVLSA